jgi:hypothetical protein
VKDTSRTMTETPAPPIRLLADFQARCGSPPDLIATAGERRAWAAAHFTGASYYILHNGDSAGRTRFDARTAARCLTLLRRPIPLWARYAAGVAALIDPALPGAHIAIYSDEPTGPRRAHAIGMAVAGLWQRAAGLPDDEVVLFRIAEQVRRVYVEIDAQPTLYGKARR